MQTRQEQELPLFAQSILSTNNTNKKQNEPSRYNSARFYFYKKDSWSACCSTVFMYIKKWYSQTLV